MHDHIEDKDICKDEERLYRWMEELVLESPLWCKVKKEEKMRQSISRRLRYM